MAKRSAAADADAAFRAEHRCSPAVYLAAARSAGLSYRDLAARTGRSESWLRRRAADSDAGAAGAVA